MTSSLPWRGWPYVPQNERAARGGGVPLDLAVAPERRPWAGLCNLTAG
jgi:hypothetical protein